MSEVQKGSVSINVIYKHMVEKYSYRLLSQFCYITGKALRSQRVSQAPDETDVGVYYLNEIITGFS